MTSTTIMKKLAFNLQFNTPAFLGDATQSARWRTPPIKALIRQWWRVAYAAEHRFSVDIQAMRNAEGRLFGHAWLENDRDQDGKSIAARKSDVRIRLDRWTAGKQTSWEPMGNVDHPEVGQIDSGLYLGFGPILNKSRLKANAAIQVDEKAKLLIAIPDEDSKLIQHALSMMDLYGTLGGRSRNGWGSFALKAAGSLGFPAANATPPLRPWRDCLRLDWPHAIGSDANGVPLIWETQPSKDWQEIMKELAMIKIGLRRQFLFPNSPPDGQIHDRHWLSYPVTKHAVKAWNNLRLPNTLRFKVRKTDSGQYVGVIFHMPCMPIKEFGPDQRSIENVWTQVHQHLDKTPARPLVRIAK